MQTSMILTLKENLLSKLFIGLSFVELVLVGEELEFNEVWDNLLGGWICKGFGKLSVCLKGCELKGEVEGKADLTELVEFDLFLLSILFIWMT